MSVWLCIPSKREPQHAGPILKLWRQQGYNIAIMRDSGDAPIEQADFTVHRSEYPGYAAAVNELAGQVFSADRSCQWVVTGGDDVEPDLNHTAQELADQCSQHFMLLPMTKSKDASGLVKGLSAPKEPTFGIMQPTGDRWGADEPWAQSAYPNMPAYIDRVCGSPWLGREFCRRINGGRGPLWPEYTHMFVDEELQNVAQGLGILWQRRDLIHLHRHWGRARGFRDDMPAFLQHVNSTEHWMASKDLFEKRKKLGFPGSEPL